MKNGLPPVFWCTTSASGSAVGDVLVQRVGDELGDVGRAQRAQIDRVDLHALPRLLLRREHQRVIRRYLVVAISRHEQQRLGRARGDDQRHEIQARGIRPLHVVEEQHERVRRLAEHLHEVLEHEVEAVLRLERLELGDARLRPMISSSAGTTSTINWPFG